jgi:anti-anti-sigma factor
MQMNVVTLEDGSAEIRLEGRLDIDGARVVDLPLATLAGARPNLVFDLTEVSFLASIGLRTIMINAKAVSKRGGRVVLFGSRPEVAQVLSSTGIDQIVPSVASRAEALALIGAAVA